MDRSGSVARVGMMGICWVLAACGEHQVTPKSCAQTPECTVGCVLEADMVWSADCWPDPAVPDRYSAQVNVAYTLRNSGPGALEKVQLYAQFVGMMLEAPDPVEHFMNIHQGIWELFWVLPEPLLPGQEREVGYGYISPGGTVMVPPFSVCAPDRVKIEVPGADPARCPL